MKKTSFALFAAAALLSLNLSAAQPAQSAQPAQPKQPVAAETQAPAKAETKQVAATTTQTMTDNNCAALSEPQRTFASQLNADNKMMFCNQFSNDQRMSAMQMKTSNPQMPADDCVVKTAQMNGMMQSKNAGGCPVR
jgi:hypothetical protein